MLKWRDCFPPPNSIQLSSPGLCFCQHFVQALALGTEVRSLLLCRLQEWNVTGWEGASIGLDSLDAASFLKDDFFDSTRKLCLFPNSKIWQGFRRQDKTDHARSVVFVYTSLRSLWIYKLVEKRGKEGEEHLKCLQKACFAQPNPDALKRNHTAFVKLYIPHLIEKWFLISPGELQVLLSLRWETIISHGNSLRIPFVPGVVLKAWN